MCHLFRGWKEQKSRLNPWSSQKRAEGELRARTREGRAPPALGLSHCVHLKSLTHGYSGNGELSSPNTALPSPGTTAETLGNVGCLQKGSIPYGCNCLLPPKAGEHLFLPHSTSLLTRCSCLCSPMHHTQLWAHTG